MSICQFVCVSVCLYACLCIWQFVYLFVCLSICLSVYLCVCPSAYLSVYLSVCLSIYRCAYLPVCLSACVSVCLSVYLPVNRLIHKFTVDSIWLNEVTEVSYAWCYIIKYSLFLWLFIGWWLAIMMLLDCLIFIREEPWVKFISS